MMFQKKRFFENKKNQSEIFNWGLLCQARQAKKVAKKIVLKKSLKLQTRGGPAAAAERVY